MVKTKTRPKKKNSDHYGYFRERVKARLNQLGWTQTKLANEIGRPKQYVSNLLTGVRNPGLGTLIDIAKALRVNPSYLIKGK